MVVINDDVVDAFTQQGIVKGTNTVTVDVLGTPVTLTLDIPATVDDRVLSDVNFSTALLDLLSTSPEALQNHIEKKQRARRSAVQMTRGQENYFYDLGMKIGGPNFKMSAAEFQAKLAAAQEIIEDEGIEMSDAELVDMILISGGIIDSNQLNLLSALKEAIYSLFENAVHKNKNLQKQFGIDGVLEIVPEEMQDMSDTVREVFDEFCELVVKAFTDRSVKNKLFDIYDNVVDNPTTKKYFKDTAGSKHSQIYDQPPTATRRAKDVSNLVGNFRHISEYMLSTAKTTRRAGGTLAPDRLERDAKQLVDPSTLSSTFNIYAKQAQKPPLLVKAMLYPEKKLASGSLEALTQRPAQITLSPAKAAPAAVAADQAMEPEMTSAPISSASDVTATKDEIMADFMNMSPQDREELLQHFESAADPEGPGPDSGLRSLYPSLSAADYDSLITQLTQLSESVVRSRVISAIRNRRRK